MILLKLGLPYELILQILSYLDLEFIFSLNASLSLLSRLSLLIRFDKPILIPLSHFWNLDSFYGMFLPNPSAWFICSPDLFLVYLNYTETSTTLESHLTLPSIDLEYFESTPKQMILLIVNNRFDLVDILTRTLNLDYSCLLHYSCEFGYIDLIELLISRNVPITPRMFDMAAFRGHLHVVEWLHSRNYTCTFEAIDEAAGNGHLEVVKWLFLHRTEGCSENALLFARENGHLDVVEWLSITNR